MGGIGEAVVDLDIPMLPLSSSSSWPLAVGTDRFSLWLFMPGVVAPLWKKKDISTVITNAQDDNPNPKTADANSKKSNFINQTNEAHYIRILDKTIHNWATEMLGLFRLHNSLRVRCVNMHFARDSASSSNTLWQTDESPSIMQFE